MNCHRKPILSLIVLALIAAPLAACSAASPHHQAAPQRAALVAYVTPVRLDAMRVSAGARLTYWREQLARTEARAAVERAHIAALEAAQARARAVRVTHPAAPAAVAAPVYGGVYSYAGMEALWREAGGAAQAAATAACIGTHESGGRPWAEHTDNPRQTDYGLMQIGFDPGALNPLEGMTTAVRMSGDGTNWSPWTTAGMCGA
jgi:hypothetical protein